MSPSDRSANRRDPSTLSNCQAINSTHLSLALSVDFDSRTLKGWAEHTMAVVTAGVKVAVFDTSSDLKIESAEVDGTKAAWSFLAPHSVFGTPVEVTLPAGLAVGKALKVKFYYSTSPSASACQWLPPEQTADKRYPYLFTQSQAIHARSIFPCQDAPAVKMTYRAQIEVPAWATVVMSALRQPKEEPPVKDGKKTYVWSQPVPIPSYLVAMGVGELESRDISPRVRVWSEPSVVDNARYEFSQTEEFLQFAEALTFPYEWQRYDLLCLPPSFPYGGMENPCCTFVTPTLLAGDRSLADVVAHEIAHSWSGNLVTNGTWEHFWLNEGWTMWLQRKVMARIHKNPLFFDLDAACIGWPHLVDDVAHFSGKAAPLTALVPDINGVDPDDAFSSVPYEKGFSLLVYIEQIVGTPGFEAFAKHYFTTYKKGTVTSADFKATLLAYFKDDPRLVSLPWNDLFYKPGLPPKPKYDTSLAKEAEQLADAWFKARKQQGLTHVMLSDSNKVFDAWPTVQKQIFLERLLSEADREGPMSVPLLEQIDSVLKLSSVKNSEIRLRWNLLCLRAGAKFILENTVDFLSTQGRMKYLRPLYRELFKSPMGKALAVETFLRNASSYHPIARKMVAADLQIKDGKATGAKAAAAEACSALACAARGNVQSLILVAGVVGVVAGGIMYLLRVKARK